MIVQFPDKDYPYVAVEFDTDTGLGLYIYTEFGTRHSCDLTRQDWEDRLEEWGIDITALIGDDLVMDIGL